MVDTVCILLCSDIPKKKEDSKELRMQDNVLNIAEEVFGGMIAEQGVEPCNYSERQDFDEDSQGL